MSNPNYTNYYIETLTSTLTDVIIRNISLQTTNRLHEDAVKEYEKTIETLDAEIGRLNQSGNDTISDLQSELVKSRKENEELQEQIRYLKMSPSKRKKYDESKIQSVEISDGGIF